MKLEISNINKKSITRVILSIYYMVQCKYYIIMGDI
jgi:hypothetical protein